MMAWRALPLALALAGRAWAADAPPVMLDGQVTTPVALDAASLKALPTTELDISFETSHGPEKAHFKGVLLWTLLDQAKPVDGPEKGAHLRHTLLVTAADGYGVSLAMGELDPRFAGKQVILAYERDGKPETAPQLVVPGDAHGGRSVHDVTRIEVK